MVSININNKHRMKEDYISLKKQFKKRLINHIYSLGFKINSNGKIISPNNDKETFRLHHLGQRREKLKRAKQYIEKKLPMVLDYFASGEEVLPRKISPKIELIKSKTIESEIFRIACLTWSIPVSEGYGRRMRFLIWDQSNGKIIGILGLGDPVFNLRVRDKLIGWQASDRKERLVNIMDAYVLGALPPYNMLLGGKLIASLVKTKEICKFFSKRYKNSRGIISGKQKKAQLVMVTTSSALGRSSIYNRLKLNGVPYFESIGYTTGFGHFHISEELFYEMRQLLRKYGHEYSDNYRFGSGPNWKFRLIRSALELLDMDRNLLNHGIEREVFICRLADNADQILRGEINKPNYEGLLSVNEVSDLALERWVYPRAQRQPEYAKWDRYKIAGLLENNLNNM